MVSIYLAAQYARRDELREYAKQAREASITVTSSWLREKKKLDASMDDWTDAKHTEHAIVDRKDIKRAQVLVLFTELPPSPPRGGRLTELGMAIAWGKEIIVVGPKEI